MTKQYPGVPWILFNHESPLRPDRFVTRKIVSAACRIARGSGEKLQLGDLPVQRDWGRAPEYVQAMWRMLQPELAEDFVIATGESHSLEEFTAAVFERLGLDWRAHVVRDETLSGPTDLKRSCGDPANAHRTLGWPARHGMREVVRMMVDAEMGRSIS